jgi:Helix-turn-helix domain
MRHSWLMETAALVPSSPVDPLLITTEAAKYLRISPGTLIKWRQRGRGPSFVRVGIRCVYRLSSLESWLREREVIVQAS